MTKKIEKKKSQPYRAVSPPIIAQIHFNKSIHIKKKKIPKGTSENHDSVYKTRH